VPLGKRQRKFLLGSGLVILIVIVVWLALPVWFPWVLRPLAATQGAHYASYTREGYSHFRLTGVTLTNRTARVSVNTLEGLVPSMWLWKLVQGTNSAPEPFAVINGWQFVSIPSGKPSSGVYSDAQDALSVFAALKKWLPIARLTNGTVRVEQTAIGVPVANWIRGELMGSAVLPEPTGAVTIRADVSGRPPFRLEAVSEALRLRSQIQLWPSAAGLEIQATNFWWSNKVDVYAQFGKTGQLPQLATLRAREFVLPAEVVHLAPYESLQGSVAAKWERGELILDLNVATQPPATQTNLPRFTLDLHARGDTNSATIQTAQLSAPWATATLSRELVVHFNGPVLDRPAQLNVAANLSSQSWVPLHGELYGQADFTPARGKWPSAGFRLAGSDIAYESLTVSNFTIAGSFDWPHVEVTNASARFPDGSLALVTGNVDLTKKVISNGSLRFNGPFANRWLQPAASYRDLSLSVNFSGPIQELTHQGNVEVVDFSTRPLRPVGLKASWLGHQEAVQRFELELAAGSSAVQAKGGFTNAPTQIDLHLNSLSLLTNREPALNLRQPVQISLQPSRGASRLHLISSPIEWSGPAGQIEAEATLDWPQAGDLHVALQRVSSGLISSFVDSNWPAIDVGHLRASAKWSNGPAAYSLELSGAKLAPGQNLQLPENSFQLLSLLSELSLQGNADGLTLSNLLVYSQTSAVVTAKGFVPLTVTPSDPTNLIHIEPQKPMELRVSAEPHAFFWKLFTDWSGVSLRDPQLRAQVSGEWDKPRGEVDLRTRELRFQNGSTNIPSLTELKVTLQLDRTQARLIDTHLLVQGQPVNLNAQVPFDTGFWQALKQKQLPNWDKATAQLRIQDAELSAFEPLFPNILAPQGSLDLNLSLSPGEKVAGELTLQNARTRPLGDFGPIRNINAKCRFLDRNLMIESVSAQISGAPLNISGHADVHGTEWLHGQLPPFVLLLRGTNVPLVRQPEAVVRGDLDLTATRTNGAPPLIAGSVHLHDSFYLADLSSLIPGKIAQPDRRPPYFSIEDPVLGDWRLAVKVDGVRFIKLGTPIFNGVVSANLALQGTLKDPIALGDLRVDSGVVRFPFASLQAQQGLVTLNSQDPYHPRVEVTAASKQFGYDIRMEVTGTADAPVIQFSSTPPLSSEQILLVVTAGQLPQGTYTLTSQQRAQTVAMFFGRDLLAKLGLSDQSQERLTVQSGQEISDQGRPTYHVEYKLSDRWSLVGEYDRFGDFNAGFKWRILSR
jgi:translocation and assembly module TamB